MIKKRLIGLGLRVKEEKRSKMEEKRRGGRREKIEEARENSPARGWGWGGVIWVWSEA